MQQVVDTLLLELGAGAGRVLGVKDAHKRLARARIGKLRYRLGAGVGWELH